MPCVSAVKYVQRVNVDLTMSLMRGRSLECEINSEEIIESQRKVDLLTCQSIICRHNDLSTVEFPTLHTPIMPMVMRSVRASAIVQPFWD